MGYNYIPKYIRQSENKSPKSVVTASRWNELFNLLIKQGDHTAEELGKILDYLSTGLEDLTSALAGASTEAHEYASAFEIHLHTNTNPITADKTFAEIRQAIVDGREITLWVSDVQCLKPACKVYESSLMLAVFDNSIPGIALRADVYECSNEDDWYVVQHIELADQAYVDGRANEKLDKTGGVISGNLGVTGKLNIGTTVSITERAGDMLQLAGDYGAPVILRNIYTPVADNDAATKKYVDERAGESVLYVNVTQSGSTITGDKTYAEILAAVTAGKCVIAKLAGMSFCLDSVSNNKITFQRLDIVEDDGEGRRSIQKTLIYVYNDGVWTADVEFVAVDTAMSDTSRMPVQNKVVKAYIDGLAVDISGKQDKLIAGENITIASDGKTISATGGGAEAMFVTITDNNGTLSADKSYSDILDAIHAGIPVIVNYAGTGLPLIQTYAEGSAFGTIMCDETGVVTIIIEITPNGEVNDMSAAVAALPNPNAITFTGAVTGSYDGSAPLSVNIPTVPTKTSQITNDSGYLTLATLPKYGGEVI